MKKNLLLSLAFATLCLAGVKAQTVLFDSPFTSDYNTQMPYRIPAIVKTGNDELIVFSDKRHGGGDVGQYQSNSAAKNAHVDLVYKRSTDNGKTWSDEQTIIRGNENMGYGDVAVVSNRENPNEIVFFCAAGNVFFTNSKKNNPLRCYRFRSVDGGRTWTNEEVTSDIYGLFSYAGAFFSSGRICQSSQIKVGNYYRLYAALCVTGTNSIVLYSDDFGESWKVLGGNSTVAVSSGNEAKCEELPDGSVLISSRKAGGRYFNVFNYTDISTGAGNWKGRKTGLSNKDAAATNGEILLVPAFDTNGNECNILLQSLPFSASRTAVGICWAVLPSGNITATSQITGLTWTDKAITTAQSGYSSMIIQGDGNIGFVYEDDYDSSLGTGGYDIKYWNLSLETITGNKYTTKKPLVAPSISLSATATTLTVGETTQLTLATDSDGDVSYISSNESVATVSTSGVITAKAAGTVTITANVDATESYKAASATVTITVKAAPVVEPEEPETPDEPATPNTYAVKAVNGKIGSISYYIATFSAPEATIVPSGVKAYYVKVGGTDVVTLVQIAAGKVIPANQGVILIASSAEFTMTATADASNAANLADNLMIAAIDGKIPAGAHVLAVKGSGELAGQFAFCLTSQALTLSGNRAYLSLASAAPQMRMRIEEETTDIDAAQWSTDNLEDAIIYDLTGRRVENPSRGVYIMNGRKVFLK